MAFLDNDNVENMISTSGLNAILGHVRGRVTDMNGFGIKHCRVWIRETGRSTYTDANGSFVLINIVPAIYTFIAECEEYPQSVLTDISIEGGDNPGHLFLMYSRNNPNGSGGRFSLSQIFPGDVPVLA